MSVWEGVSVGAGVGGTDNLVVICGVAFGGVFSALNNRSCQFAGTRGAYIQDAGANSPPSCKGTRPASNF